MFGGLSYTINGYYMIKNTCMPKKLSDILIHWTVKLIIQRPDSTFWLLLTSEAGNEAVSTGPQRLLSVQWRALHPSQRREDQSSTFWKRFWAPYKKQWTKPNIRCGKHYWVCWVQGLRNPPERMETTELWVTYKSGTLHFLFCTGFPLCIMRPTYLCAKFLI